MHLDLEKFPPKIPTVRHPDHPVKSPLDLEDSSVGLLIRTKNGWMFEDEGGTFNPDREFKRLFKKKYNFSYWAPGTIDYALNHLTRKQKFDIEFVGETTIDEGHLWWPSPSVSLRLGSGRYSRYLINIRSWVKPGWCPKSLGDIKGVIEKFKILQEYGLPISPISQPSTTSNLLLDTHPEEFYWIRKFSGREELVHILKEYQRAYPTRIEWLSMGRVTGVTNKDQVKAHLSKFMKIPSLSQENIITTIEGATRKFGNAHPGSIYKIETTIPRDLPVGPIPCKHLYPIDHIPESDPISRPHLDLLEELKIPYKILWSYQILLRDMESLPWPQVCTFIWYIEEKLKDQLYPLSLKNIHYTLVAHMLHIRDVRDLRTYGVTGTTTSLDYNPPIPTAVKSLVHCENFRMSLKVSGLKALREDAVTALRLPDNSNGFVLESQGDQTNFTPNFRDKPGDTTHRDYAMKYRDMTAIPLTREVFNSIHDQDTSRLLGKPEMITKFIHPDPWLRHLPPKEITNLNLRDSLWRVGDFLEDEIKCVPPIYIPGYGLDLEMLKKWEEGAWCESWEKQIFKELEKE